MTKALLFDLGNVLIPFDFSRGYRALAPHTACAPDEIRARITASGLVPPYERGELSSRQFYEKLSAALGLCLGYEEFCEIWSVIFLPEPLVPVKILEELRRRCRLVLISNTNEIHFTWIRRTYPLIALFDALVLSYEVGAMKPAERIYQEAVRQAGCLPGECFYTDDVPEFVDGARRIGIDAVAFTGAADLERHLRRRGLLA